MKSVFALAGLFLIAVTVPAPAEAQTLRAGFTELSLTGRIQGASFNGETRTSAIIDALVGYLVTPKIEAGVNFTTFKSEGVDATGAVSGVFMYNFPTRSRIVPFASASLGRGYGYSETTGNPLMYGFGGGVRLMTAGGGGAFVVQPYYRRQSFSSALGDASVNMYGVSFGVSMFF
jgi:hypothetical protein